VNRLTDQQLLRDYTRRRSEAAFTELVRRHVDFVYSAALRMVRDTHLAEDVSQGVFVALAHNARQLADRPVLSGWLHRTAQNLAANAVRSEVRRRAREQKAAAMNELTAAEPEAVWEHIAPHLDAALGELSEPDRDALLLRYFERKSAREMAQTLGVSDDAAQKRVSRAVERLREFFAKHGITVGASGLAVAISANAVQAAPVGLAATISTAAALAALSIPALAGVGAGTGFIGVLSQVPRTKLVVGLAATVLVGVATFISLRSPHRPDRDAAPDNLQNTAANPEQNQQTAAPATPDANVADEREPDPLKLLMAVARARQRIESGSMELELSTDRYERGRKETTQSRFAVLFDGPKLRFEARAREYAYTVSGTDESAEAKELVRRADSMDKEAAVRAGLLEGFEAHEITASDGATLMRYREHNGTGGSTTVEDPAKGSAGSPSYFFDPRCLGLRPSLYFSSTIEGCLGYSEAKFINLVGKESVEGVSAWHVELRSKHDETLDFWIDVAQPARLLKQSKGDDFVLSKYDDANPRDPIPIELTTMSSSQNGSLSFGNRFIRSKAQFNMPVDPASFTLAGLGMPVGTPVTDIRIHRIIGYWTGTGLEFLPSQKRTEPQRPPNLAELLALLENYPASSEALNAAAWILLNTPDGPEVEKAAEVIRREHSRDTNLVYLCTELERVRRRCSKPLLETILKDNPSAEVRGTACFTLATLLKDEAKYGQNKQATAQAEKQFERVITEFGQVKQRGYELEDLAKPELSELRRLTIGKPAPEIEGEDLDGRPMKLSDYRGKVVVLTFWWLRYTEAPEHRKLVERMAGKPFAFIGVYGEDDLTKGKAEVEKYGITWPSFWDKHDGPISTNWNVRSWPNIWVLDPQGVICYRGVRGRELNEAVDTLLRE